MNCHRYALSLRVTFMFTVTVKGYVKMAFCWICHVMKKLRMCEGCVMFGFVNVVRYCHNMYTEAEPLLFRLFVFFVLSTATTVMIVTRWIVL